ncbi:tetratricopeptide repeat protein [Tumebacillus sp. BK434]|uniref:helix-turn-helix domain-containing protein n=1 Tax=Tumebacillus sp. BK434 TaxID=2512169 RepID=UPI0010486FBC|nr:tetratricopeptide repeat protein [Tumebacillus sp. BK434]TCP57812.1 tetratricopeptide repeat protein [Tumebacillus sp. BK434]
MNNSSLGERIKKARKESEMTQNDLARGIVTSSMICQIENGKAYPSYKVLAALADRLARPIEYFVSDTETNVRQRSSFTLAKALMASGSYAKAYSLLKSMQDFGQGEAEEFHMTMAKCCQELGKYDEAIEMLDRLLAESHGNLHQVFTIYLRLGEVAEHSGQYQLALYHWKKAYEMLDRVEADPFDRAQLLTSIGNTYHRLGVSQEAVLYLQQAFEERKEKVSLEDLGQMFLTLSLTYHDSNNFDQASLFSERAHAIFRSLNHFDLATEVKLSLAVLMAKQHGKIDEALQILDECTERYMKQDDRYNIGLTQLETAFVLQMAGETGTAISLVRESLDLITGDDLELARAHRLLADLYRAEHRLKDAINHLSQSLHLYQKHGHSVGMMEAMHLSVSLYQEWEQFRKHSFGELITA